MKKFKPLLHSIGTMVILFVGSSCTSDMYGTGPSTQRGSVTGGLTGAALGAIVGNQSGRPLEGAALGGLIGAAAGSALGNAKDQEEGYIPQKRYRYIPSPPVVIMIIIPIVRGHPEDIALLLTEIHFISATGINNFKTNIKGQHQSLGRPHPESLGHDNRFNVLTH